MTECQAKSHPFLAPHLFCAEIGIKYFRHIFRSDADSGVFETNVQILTRLESEVICCGQSNCCCRNVQRTTLRHCFAGIDGQVGDHLAYLIRINRDKREVVREIDDTFDGRVRA